MAIKKETKVGKVGKAVEFTRKNPVPNDDFIRNVLKSVKDIQATEGPSPVRTKETPLLIGFKYEIIYSNGSLASGVIHAGKDAPTTVQQFWEVAEEGGGTVGDGVWINAGEVYHINYMPLFGAAK